MISSYLLLIEDLLLLKSLGVKIALTKDKRCLVSGLSSINLSEVIMEGGSDKLISILAYAKANKLNSLVFSRDGQMCLELR